MTKMNNEFIKRHDVIQRYLHGTLSANELIAFEEYIMLHPDIIEDIQLSEAFKRGLSGQPSQVKNKRFGWIGPFFGALAGGVAVWIMFGLGLSVSTPPPNSPNLVFIETLRGNIDQRGSQAQATVNRNGSAALFVIDVSHLPQPRFDLLLKDIDGNTVQHWISLKPNTNGELVLPINSAELSTGTYTMHVVNTIDGATVLQARVDVE